MDLHTMRAPQWAWGWALEWAEKMGVPPRYDLLFGVIALQMQFITPEQFAEAAILSASRPDGALSKVLLDQQMLAPTAKHAIDALIAAKIAAGERPTTTTTTTTATTTADGNNIPASSAVTAILPPPYPTGEMPTETGPVALSSTDIERRANETLLALGVDPTEFDRQIAQGNALGVSETMTVLALTRPVDPAGKHAASTSPTPVPVVLSREKRDRYEFKREVARGGLGRICLVYDRDCRRDIAWKELLDAAHVDPLRFLEEAQITAQLEHPNIVPIYELGSTAEDKPYYTMRFIRGRPMTDFIREMDALRKENRLDGKREALLRMRLLTAFQGAAQAVAYAHAKGVIHRDLKPGNIMLGDYGEVLVVDWGLAKARSRNRSDDTVQWVETLRQSSGHETLAGTIAGTPAYMSPEQAAGRIDEVDERSDVYSLGAVLYEILTHRMPFEGPNALAVLQDVRAGRFVPPSERTPEYVVPKTLEEICLKAMALNRDERIQTVEELYEAVTLFIEGTQEREKMHARAEEKAAQAQKIRDRYWELVEAEKAAKARFDELNKEIVGYEPPEIKRPLWSAEAEYERLRDEVQETYNSVIKAYNECLGFEPDNPTARTDMAEFYWRQFLVADRADRINEAKYYRSQVEFFDDGRFAAALVGDGALVLATDPPGGKITLGRYEESERVLQVIEPRELGAAPVVVEPLAMGSYLATVRSPGFRPVNVPIRIDRQARVERLVRLYPSDFLGENYVQVPAGDFISGDETVPGGKPKEIRAEDDFFISQYPVTCAEYLAFLNDLHAVNPEKAVAHQPRAAADSGFYWIFDETSGAYRLPEGDEIEKFHWQPEWPVMSVNWDDAMAYCEWLEKRLGMPVSLPTAAQWEKAARGVDARKYPWGNKADPAHLNCTQTRKNDARIMPVGSFPLDCSPYGMFDAAGNIGEWCRDDVGEKYPRWKHLRGGYWSQTVEYCALAIQRGYGGDSLFAFIGFRTVVLPPTASPTQHP